MKNKITDDVAIMEMARGFQPAAVVIAAAELDVFTILHTQPMDAAQLTRRIKGDLRATIILLDALVALGLLKKGKGADAKPLYRVTRSAAQSLTDTGSQSILSMVRHLGNCYRSWGDLARTVQSGTPAERQPSVRGASGDLTSFIQAMQEISDPMAMPLIKSLGDLDFSHLLDLGGATGSWTIPFLQLNPEASATIFDQPAVIPMARRLMKKAWLVGCDWSQVIFILIHYQQVLIWPGSAPLSTRTRGHRIRRCSLKCSRLWCQVAGS